MLSLTDSQSAPALRRLPSAHTITAKTGLCQRGAGPRARAAAGPGKGSVPLLMTSEMRQRGEAEVDGPWSPQPSRGTISGTPGPLSQLRAAKVPTPISWLVAE